MRIALVHDWLTGMRGGEKVLSLLCGLLPEADVLTLVHVRGSCDRRIERMRIRTSFLDDLPAVGRYYRFLLPLMPLAIEAFSAEPYDLVISSSHCVAKGVICPPRALHVCYCYTPMRYVWAQAAAYQSAAGLAGMGLLAFRKLLRTWDGRSAARVSHFIAISRTVADRIRRTYRRDAQVIYPPVNTTFYTPDGRSPEDFYLMVTALVPYKRVDQAIEAFNRLGRPLCIIGSGPQRKRLAASAGPNVTFLGWQSDDVLRDHYRRCRALIFPGEEDFGIIPVEAMACGAPVIAFGAGGATETVLDAAAGPPGPTGLLYTPQTPDALADAVLRFERHADAFEPARLRNWAVRFGERRFLDEFARAVGALAARRGLAKAWSNAIVTSWSR